MNFLLLSIVGIQYGEPWCRDRQDQRASCAIHFTVIGLQANFLSCPILAMLLALLAFLAVHWMEITNEPLKYARCEHDGGRACVGQATACYVSLLGP